MIVNGQYQTEIAIADRGLQYGDGCFTTIAYRHGCLEFYDAHIQRLKKACRILYIDFTAWAKLTQSIKDSLNDVSSEVNALVIKIIITRGEGGRGYSPAGSNNANFIITHHPYPEFYSQWKNTGLPLTVSPILLAKQPILAGIKHLNRLEQVLVKKALLSTSFDDALVCDTDGVIIESSMANIFWKENHQWYTPNLSGSGVEGVMRNQVLAVLHDNDIEVNIVSQRPSDLLNIEEMFICNCLMGLVPVSCLYNPCSDKQINVPKVQQTRLFQSWIDKHRTEQGLYI
ncbi:aminodeoxychorismate lyase [Paraglaciecola sp. L3A3]|uniref:aminodeoxychorismate lyase n=1 Tax=Paraglaciecola sp. L3A3 TaxID=2686358 RepID=UPI00131E5B18|nr:aminodeoxychorismate lyase [Paraglaciecola sp. L3A3]